MDTPAMDRELWIGCDPGLTGGLVALNERGKLLGSMLMPLVGAGVKSRRRVDAGAIHDWYEDMKGNCWNLSEQITWAIERVSSMPTDGALQAFRFGAATHTVIAAAEWSGDRLVQVSPKDWQKAFLRGYPKNGRDQIKASAALAAGDRWPELKKDLKVKARWGLADAAFVADSARIIEQTRRVG
tara:strand:+ start:2129 stop:2680 length:552 start_codon:yes stop_codon:yes gene_type:complete